MSTFSQKVSMENGSTLPKSFLVIDARDVMVSLPQMCLAQPRASQLEACSY